MTADDLVKVVAAAAAAIAVVLAAVGTLLARVAGHTAQLAVNQVDTKDLARRLTELELLVGELARPANQSGGPSAPT